MRPRVHHHASGLKYFYRALVGRAGAAWGEMCPLPQPQRTAPPRVTGSPCQTVAQLRIAQARWCERGVETAPQYLYSALSADPALPTHDLCERWRVVVAHVVVGCCACVGHAGRGDAFLRLAQDDRCIYMARVLFSQSRRQMHRFVGWGVLPPAAPPEGRTIECPCRVNKTHGKTAKASN